MDHGHHHDHGMTTAITTNPATLAERDPAEHPSDHLAIEGFTSLSFAAEGPWLAANSEFSRQSMRRGFRAKGILCFKESGAPCVPTWR